MGHPTGNFGLVGRCGCQCGLLGAAFVLAAFGHGGTRGTRAPGRAGWHCAGAPAGCSARRTCGTGGRGRAFQPLRAAGRAVGPQQRWRRGVDLSGWQTGPPVPRGRAGGFGAGVAVAGPAPGVVGCVGGRAHHGAPGDAAPRADGFSFLPGRLFWGSPLAVVGRRVFSSTGRYVCCTGASSVKPGRTITQSPQPGASSGHWCDSGSLPP